MVVICFVFVKRASEGAAIRAGSKLECVELRYVSFLLRIHFLSANEKNRIFLARPELLVNDILRQGQHWG